MEPSGRNPWQPAAKGTDPKTAQTSRSAAGGNDVNLVRKDSDDGCGAPASLRTDDPRGASPCQAQIASETQLDERDVAEDIGRFCKQPAQLFDRRGCRRMHLKILDRERQRRGSATGPESVELSPERALRLDPSRESTDLRPWGAGRRRERYAHNGSPWALLLLNLKTVLLRHRGTSSNRHRGPSATGSGRLTPLSNRGSQVAQPSARGSSPLGSIFPTQIVSFKPADRESFSRYRVRPWVGAGRGAARRDVRIGRRAASSRFG